MQIVSEATAVVRSYPRPLVPKVPKFRSSEVPEVPKFRALRAFRRTLVPSSPRLLSEVEASYARPIEKHGVRDAIETLFQVVK